MHFLLFNNHGIIKKEIGYKGTHMKKVLSVLSLLLLLFLPTCKRKVKEAQLPEAEAPISTSVDIPEPSGKHMVVLQVEGVECQLCAKLVTDKLEAMDGISNVRYVLHNGDYEQGYVQFDWQKEASLPIKELLTKIESQGFNLVQIRGPFMGRFVLDYNRQQVFRLDDFDLSFPVSLSEQASIPIEEKNWPMLLEKGKVEVVAALKLIDDGQAFIFVPKRLYEML